MNHDLRGKKHFGIWMMILFVNSPKSIDPTLGKATKSNYIFSKKKKKNNLVKIVESKHIWTERSKRQIKRRESRQRSNISIPKSKENKGKIHKKLKTNLNSTVIFLRV